MAKITAAEIVAWAEKQRLQMSVFGLLEVQVFIKHAIKYPLMHILNLISDHQIPSHLRGFSKVRTGALRYWDLVRLLILLFRIRNRILNKLPEVTKKTTWHSNSHILIDMEREFFEGLRMPSREKELRAMWKIGTIFLDYDKPYRFLGNKVLKLWLKHADDWVWHDEDEPTRYWEGD